MGISTGILPTACAASVCITIPRLRASVAISAIGLNRADLIVGLHDTDQNGRWADGALDIIDINHAVFVNRQVSHFKADRFQILADLDDCRMFNLRRDDMIAFVAVLQRVIP